MRSQAVAPEYWLTYCADAFGEGFKDPQIDRTNNYYGGLEIQGENIFFANAGEDPWQWAGMRSIYDPVTQANMRAVLMDCNDCGHCRDISTPVPSDPIEVTQAREAIFLQLTEWLAADSLKQ